MQAICLLQTVRTKSAVHAYSYPKGTIFLKVREQSIVERAFTIYKTYLRKLVMSKVTHFCRAVHGIKTSLLLTRSFQTLQQKYSQWLQYFHHHLEICENSLYLFICIFHKCVCRAESRVSDNIMAVGYNWDRTGNVYVKRNAISQNLRTGTGSGDHKLPKISLSYLITTK